jgi:hypothetical protein
MKSTMKMTFWQSSLTASYAAPERRAKPKASNIQLNPVFYRHDLKFRKTAEEE